jgi:hypothetical protein
VSAESTDNEGTVRELKTLQCGRTYVSAESGLSGIQFSKNSGTLYERPAVTSCITDAVLSPIALNRRIGEASVRERLPHFHRHLALAARSDHRVSKPT